MGWSRSLPSGVAFSAGQPLQPAVIDVNRLITDTTKPAKGDACEQIEIKTMLQEISTERMVDPGQLTAFDQQPRLNSASDAGAGQARCREL